MKFNKKEVCKTLFSGCDFSENRSRRNNILLRCVTEFKFLVYLLSDLNETGCYQFLYICWYRWPRCLKANSHIPYRSHAVNSHMPYCNPAILRECRVLRGSPHRIWKYPFVRLRVVAGRSRTRAGRQHAVSGRPMLVHIYHASLMPRCTVALRGRCQNGMVVAWEGNGMTCLWIKHVRTV
jgi:hypothetical protein